jgi:hypothetical protein
MYGDQVLGLSLKMNRLTSEIGSLKSRERQATELLQAWLDGHGDIEATKTWLKLP